MKKRTWERIIWIRAIPIKPIPPWVFWEYYFFFKIGILLDIMDRVEPYPLSFKLRYIYSAEHYIYINFILQTLKNRINPAITTF